ncbi:MAG: DUF389 domain-containing protein [Ilumatobacter sp.]
MDGSDARESLVDDVALADDASESTFSWSRVDVSLLKNPAVIRSLAIIPVAVLVVLWPQRTDRILAALIAIGLLAVCATSAWVALRARPRRWLLLATSTAGIATGAWLLASPERSTTFLGRLIGVGIAVVAVRDLVSDWNADVPDGDRAWLGFRALWRLGLASLLIAFPAELVAAVSTFAALGWIAFAVVVLVVSLDRNRSGLVGTADSGRLVKAWLAERPKSLEDRTALYDKILFDGPLSGNRIIRFFTLMVFASVIASMGIISDSTAVVIGAMLIAPLMTPLMGMAISLVMGWPRRLARSSLLAFGGIATTISIGALLGLTVPAVIDVATNTQIVSRATPTVLDLIIAVAAGAAGAYGLSRPDVSDSLPGVAIAIALVPPLAAVGISWSQGDWDAGAGALLLFTTNMLAILVIGGITFVFTGVAPIKHIADSRHRVRTSVAAIGTATAIVLGLLLLNNLHVATNLFDASTIEDTVDEWIAPHPEHGVVRINTDGDVVTVAIIGPAGGAPNAADLAALLDNELDRRMTADVRLIVEERDIARSDAGGG